MPYRFFRISTSSPQAADELNQFIASHRVVHVEKNFHADGADGYWSFCLQWQEGSAAASTSTTKTASQVDFKAVLSEAQFAVFSKLRDLRKQLGQSEGIPVYAIATNEQLAAMVREPITSVTGLQKIPGFGEAKVNRYGNAFLELIRQNLELITRESQAIPNPSQKSSDAKSPESEPD